MAVGVALSPVPIIAIVRQAPVRAALPSARGAHVAQPAQGGRGSLDAQVDAGDRQVRAGKALGMGVVLSALNPKNLALTIAAAAAIAQVGISTGEEVGALAVFILLGSLSILAPVAIYFALSKRAATILGDLKDWIDANNATIMTVLLLVLGAKLIGDGISGLS
jgi:threonine/homoserine/homoserine lactone efflux protein